MKSKKFSCEIAGRTLTAEFSNLAEQANGSVLLSYGETVVLATAVMAKTERAGINFFPLSVDYEEKFYAAGQILGSRFVRRESRPSEDAILVNRLIDRTIRPLFIDQGMKNDVQVIVTAFSIDDDNDPDVIAALAASLALSASDIPWDGPVSGVRVGFLNGNFVINPTYKERENSEMDVVVCGKSEKINMIEAGAKEASEAQLIEAFKKAIPEIEKINDFQRDVIKAVGKEKIKVVKKEISGEVLSLFKKDFLKRLEESLYLQNKTERTHALGDLKKEWMEAVKLELDEKFLREADDLYESKIDELVHINILKNDKRPDGRKLDEVRELFVKSSFLPRTHGSGIFYRGDTHILSVATLASPEAELLIEGMETRMKKRFMHHYNFPPFSVGETGMLRGPGRREIGHGALAEKALRYAIPDKKDFPYTIRVVSETLSSNGSSSMGSVCASTLAMLSAGVPMKAPVAGIAMGLMMKDEKNFKVLTDLQGPEDHHGDMDFKAAGTRDGVTALQMDVKVEGVTVEILEKTLEQAKEARMQILDVMAKEINAPAELSPYAPKITMLTIPKEKIGEVIGGGGRTINGIIDKTGVKIDIEEDGTVYVSGIIKSAVEEAVNIIKALTREFQVGEIAEGRVSRIFEFGAMVELSPKIEGLIHISKLSKTRVNRVTDVVQIGDSVEVEVISIDEQRRVNLRLIKKI